jgi:2-oxoglutarate dehydrogenase E1 component
VSNRAQGARAPGPDEGEGSASDLDEVSEPSSPYYRDFGINAGFVEQLEEDYQADPGALDGSWDERFSGSAPVRPAPSDPAPSHPTPPQPPESPAAAPAIARQSPARAPVAPVLGPTPVRETVDPQLSLKIADKYARVLRLIHFFRARGHRVANSDPLGGHSSYFPELDPAHYGLGHDDMDQLFTTGDLPGGSVQTLREILDRLKRTYCGTMGAEYTHVQDPGRKAWLREVMEETQNQPRIDAAEKQWILEKLSEAESFERFLHTKFLGQKRFSLEGAETMIPMLDTIAESSPEFGVREIVLGMSHRGRLNVLANFLGKSYESIFSEFEDNPLIHSPFGSGDVKYHKGYSADRFVRTGERVHLTLTSNPSHLEAVNPVVEGRAKAKQVRAGDLEGETILPVLLHGDAAFAGQGIVAETLNLSQLRGYCTGGTIHIIVNNQIGFTTTPSEARSTLYCTDVAKMIQVPIFHVNGDDPEAAVHCMKLAMAYRQRFGDDVVIDLVCYRRHGHNEGDEPAFTQPRLYAKIRKRPSVRKLYADHLVEQGVLSSETAAGIERAGNEKLQKALQVIQTLPPGPDEPYEPHGPWSGFSRLRPEVPPDTSIEIERLAKIAEGLGAVPSYFNVHPKLRGLLDKRGKLIAEGAPIDWAMGEAMAFGSLLLEGTPVRLSGQDCSRGTFSHRHAVYVDQDSGEEYAPLDHISGNQARFEVYDSLLSEAAVLGFDYGFSLADPSTLVLWEAQFGDFVNGAQVIIDQFITSAHVKWGRMSGLIMLLPHGYEGQGPEHSSARIERFLQICAEDCLQVVNCTTSAQYFHVLRRQMQRNYRAPMVIFTPKSLLRSPLATSRVDDFTHGSFQTVIDDGLAAEQPDRVRRIVFSFGKVHYDLVSERKHHFGDEAGPAALVRIEELYPWPEERLREILASYRNVESVYWAQEEPANMGGWTFVRERLQQLLPEGVKLAYAGRAEAASTATGSLRVHKEEQASLCEAAFAGL